MPGSAGGRVGYLGPEGTFSEAALLASAAPGAVEPVGLASIHEVVVSLREGALEWAIVPIENSLDGSISVTLDLLAEQAGELEIVAEALLRVSHSLIASAPVALSEIEIVLSHPQVPGQCERFLRGELAHARILPAASTAEAVRTVVSEARRSQAALGTLLAAEIYGGTVLREGVQDSEENETRFVWLARAGAAEAPPLAEAPDGGRKTSLFFWGAGAEHAGWLVRCLDEFARREINLTKIESRPRRERLGSYMFFADLSGDARDAVVAEAIAGLGALCEEVRVLGSYPAAPAPDASRAPAPRPKSAAPR
ncbi:MAG TPA: prephenate dehydratase [Solirubrobacteraceae bacterium]|jgi:prephenate dehydratase|nr:prephenate dehydratase [Solirubrobacteraceae bacterium]